MRRSSIFNGYRLEYRNEPFTGGDVSAAKGKSADLLTSLGIIVDEAGAIKPLVDSPAWRAGLGYDMKIVGVKTPESGDATVAYSADALREAVRQSATTGEVELLVDWSGRIRPVRIAYNGGLRYPALVPVEGRPDLLREIARPRTTSPESPGQNGHSQ